MQKTHGRIGQHPLRFVRRILIIAVRYGDGVAVSLPFLGVSSLNFGPLATAAFFLRLKYDLNTGMFEEWFRFAADTKMKLSKRPGEYC